MLRYEMLVDALGFDLGLNDTPGFDYDKWIKPSRVHKLYGAGERDEFPEEALFVRTHQVCECLLAAMLEDTATASFDPAQADPWAAPLLPDLIKAFSQLTLWTSLKHAAQTGSVVSEFDCPPSFEGATEYDSAVNSSRPPGMPRTVELYCSALREGDHETWVGLFHDTPYFEDPKGSRPVDSRRELRSRFDYLRKLFPRIDHCEFQILATGDSHLQVRWTIAGASFLGGIPASASRDQTFHFAADGRIRAAIADWQPQALAKQLLEQHREAMLDAIDQPDG